MRRTIVALRKFVDFTPGLHRPSKRRKVVEKCVTNDSRLLKSKFSFSLTTKQGQI